MAATSTTQPLSPRPGQGWALNPGRQSVLWEIYKWNKKRALLCVWRDLTRQSP